MNNYKHLKNVLDYNIIKMAEVRSIFCDNAETHCDKLYKGYRLIAIDGSELPIDNSILDKETALLKHGGKNQTYSAYHLNASYDLLECTYDDLIIQVRQK